MLSTGFDGGLELPVSGLFEILLGGRGVGVEDDLLFFDGAGRRSLTPTLRPPSTTEPRALPWHRQRVPTPAACGQDSFAIDRVFPGHRHRSIMSGTKQVATKSAIQREA